MIEPYDPHSLPVSRSIDRNDGLLLAVVVIAVAICMAVLYLALRWRVS